MIELVNGQLRFTDGSKDKAQWASWCQITWHLEFMASSDYDSGRATRYDRQAWRYWHNIAIGCRRFPDTASASQPLDRPAY